jgi:general secretion pathway protein I
MIPARLRPATGRGFTLLEVLIALAILALSAAAVMRQTQLGLRQQQQLELKSAALWVADDSVAALSSLTAWPPLGRAQRTVEFREQSWDVFTDVSDTPDPNMRKIIVSVQLSGQGEEQGALVSFTTFRGRY